MISKTLGNWLKNCMDVVISPYQSAFIKGKAITNNILLALELIQFMKNNKSRRSYQVAIKIDFKKAYDSERWDFISKVMQVLKFPQDGIQMIM